MNAFNWFYVDGNGNAEGPTNAEILKIMFDEGLIGPGTLVSKGDADNWRRLRTVASELDIQIPDTDEADDTSSDPSLPGEGAGGEIASGVEDEKIRRLRIFVGHNFDCYWNKWGLAPGQKPSSWNWAAFLLGPFWMAYRKMYLYAYTWVGISILNSLLGMAVLGTIALTIGLGILGNSLYRLHADKKIRHTTASFPSEQAESVLKEEGGTSWIGVIAMVMVEAFIAFVSLAIDGQLSSGYY